MRIQWILSLSLIFTSCLARIIYIHDYTNAIHGESTIADALQNGKAVSRAILDAGPDDTVLLESSEVLYYIPDQYWEGIQNMTFRLDGKVVLHDDYSAWPMISENEYASAFDFRNSQQIRITGSGKLDGQGFAWWSAFKKGQVVRRRPTMLLLTNSTNVQVDQLKLLNGPRFHIYADNVTYMEVHDIEIFVRWDKTKTFPYNTDGIDASGTDIHIYNNKITNYDDAIAIKPMKDSCTERVLVEKNHIIYGAGISIGSVPSSHHHCVKNVTFQHIYAKSPMKLIYIKTEGPDQATTPVAMISDIIYKNITADGPWAWPIYIGPQQQKEPDGDGPGVWPDTNPYVNIRNITIQDVRITNINAAEHAGVLRCNHSNPCENIVFDNVQMKGTNLRYLCDDENSIYGNYINTNPSPKNCIQKVEGKKTRAYRGKLWRSFSLRESLH